MRDLLKVIFHPWALFGSVALAVLTSVGVLAYLSYSAPPPSSIGVPTANVTKIPAPTATEFVIILPTEIPTPTLEAPPAPPPGTLTLGSVIQITGTDGAGLNLRSEPSLESTILYLGFEFEVFEISDGPIENDGVIWWYLIGFSDASRGGWGASNFLEIVQNP